MFPHVANTMLLALESNQVIWMRIAAVSRCGPDTLSEMALMMSEKMEASASAMSNLAAGGSPDSVVSAYREIVQANLKRLSA